MTNQINIHDNKTNQGKTANWKQSSCDECMWQYVCMYVLYVLCSENRQLHIHKEREEKKLSFAARLRKAQESSLWAAEDGEQSGTLYFPMATEWQTYSVGHK